MGETLVDNQAPVLPVHNDFFAEKFMDNNSWLLAYASEFEAASKARQVRLDGLFAFVNSSMQHYEQLSGCVSPSHFSSELALEYSNPNAKHKFWSYGSLSSYLAERIPIAYYTRMGVSATEDLALEIQMAIDSCLIWVLCENEKMRGDMTQAYAHYKRGQPIEGYAKDGVFQDVNVCDVEGKVILTIRLHLFPDFIPKQKNIAQQIGLVRRKGAIEYGVLGTDIQGNDCYNTEYRTIAWGFRKADGTAWKPEQLPPLPVV